MNFETAKIGGGLIISRSLIHACIPDVMARSSQNKKLTNRDKADDGLFGAERFPARDASRALSLRSATIGGTVDFLGHRQEYSLVQVICQKIYDTKNNKNEIKQPSPEDRTAQERPADAGLASAAAALLRSLTGRVYATFLGLCRAVSSAFGLGSGQDDCQKYPARKAIEQAQNWAKRIKHPLFTCIGEIDARDLIVGADLQFEHCFITNLALARKTAVDARGAKIGDQIFFSRMDANCFGEIDLRDATANSYRDDFNYKTNQRCLVWWDNFWRLVGSIFGKILLPVAVIGMGIWLLAVWSIGVFPVRISQQPNANDWINDCFDLIRLQTRSDA